MIYDLIIIGSGPGGYVGAIRAAQLGLKTAIIEKYPTLGGTCLNVGCIPSKALLDSSELYHKTRHSFKDHGIDAGNISLNMEQMIRRKNEVVKQTCDGVSFLMKKNKVDVFFGTGSFKDKTHVGIISGDERNVCVVREISKIHEQFHFGTAPQLLDEFEKKPEKVKGEMVLIISGL